MIDDEEIAALRAKNDPVRRPDVHRLIDEVERLYAILAMAGDDLATATAVAREFDRRNEETKASLASIRDACAPLIEWLSASLPGSERLGAPGAIVGPGQVHGRDVGLTVAQARTLFDALTKPR